MRRPGYAIALVLVIVAGCDGGIFGSDEEEDHRFLVDLRNISLAPVTIKLAQEPEGFLVQGISVTTIQRSAEPGAELVFEAIVGEDFLAQSVSCRYNPPSDVSPRRRVSWNGADLQCLSWN